MIIINSVKKRKLIVLYTCIPMFLSFLIWSGVGQQVLNIIECFLVFDRLGLSFLGESSVFDISISISESVSWFISSCISCIYFLPFFFYYSFSCTFFQSFVYGSSFFFLGSFLLFLSSFIFSAFLESYCISDSDSLVSPSVSDSIFFYVFWFLFSFSSCIFLVLLSIFLSFFRSFFSGFLSSSNKSSISFYYSFSSSLSSSKSILLS